MRYDDISLKVRESVANLFERDAATLSDDTLLMQDLPCESIDLLEVSVQLGATFHIFVDEERAFLRSLRYQLAGAPDAAAFLREHYGHLDETGSFLWPLIDGRQTVYELAAPLKERFGEAAEPLYPRIAKYFQILHSYGFVRLTPKA